MGVDCGGGVATTATGTAGCFFTDVMVSFAVGYLLLLLQISVVFVIAVVVDSL